MIRRCLCIAFVEWQSRHKVHSVSRTAEALHRRLQMSMEDASSMLKQMVDAGGRFVNLEMHAGEGVSIILGQGSESRWIKLLPKKGEQFKKMVQHLRDLQLHERYPRECELRVKVVNWLLSRFDGGMSSPANSISPDRSPPLDLGLAKANFTTNNMVAAP